MFPRFLLPIIALAIGTSAWAEDWPETRFRGPTMGTTWSVVLPYEVELEDANELQVAIEENLAEANALMSNWDKNSAVSRFNDDSSSDFVEVDAELSQVFSAALAVRDASGHAYDVSLGEVYALYAIGGEAGAAAELSPEERKASVGAALARARSGTLEQRGNTWRKPDPQVRVDLSSIAKGRAVDRLGEMLEARDMDTYLVEVGGEVRTRGLAGDNKPWVVGIEMPDGHANEGLALEDAHVASSGTYRNWRELNGELVSHVIDGRTAEPVSHTLESVTVLADSTMEADAWATALLVLGPDDARGLAEETGLDVQLVTRDGNGYSVWRSDGFAEQIAR